jgi:mono/diheme cytochrome c family protein
MDPRRTRRCARSLQPRVARTCTTSRSTSRYTHFYTGLADGAAVDTFPYPVTREMVDRGQERYDVFCAPCHDRAGTGRGMIVRRGYRQPPSLHEARLKGAPAGYYFDVMTNGFGVMPDYRAQVPPADRWAITAYIRALQEADVSPAPAAQPTGDPESAQPGSLNPDGSPEERH